MATIAPASSSPPARSFAVAVPIDRTMSARVLLSACQNRRFRGDFKAILLIAFPAELAKAEGYADPCMK
jgi:hypothetical protein